eukprot:COSAG04_NODE_9987_length_814_cov_2.008392_1_plen_166_part_00
MPASVASAALDRLLVLRERYGDVSGEHLTYVQQSEVRDLMFLAFNFADFGRGDSSAAMTVDDIDLLGNGDLFFTFRKEKGKYNRVIPGTEWRWPAHSCPDLLLAVGWWLRLRRSLRGSEWMWQLPRDLYWPRVRDAESSTPGSRLREGDCTQTAVKLLPAPVLEG